MGEKTVWVESGLSIARILANVWGEGLVRVGVKTKREDDPINGGNKKSRMGN